MKKNAKNFMDKASLDEKKLKSINDQSKKVEENNTTNSNSENNQNEEKDKDNNEIKDEENKENVEKNEEKKSEEEHKDEENKNNDEEKKDEKIEEEKKEEENKEDEKKEEEKKEEEKKTSDDGHPKSLKEITALLSNKINSQGGFRSSSNMPTSNKNNDIIHEPKGNPENVVNIIQNQKIITLFYIYLKIKMIKINKKEKEEIKDNQERKDILDDSKTNINKNSNILFGKNEEIKDNKEKILFEKPTSKKQEIIDNSKSHSNILTSTNILSKEKVISTNAESNLSESQRIEDNKEVQTALQNLYISDILLPSPFSQRISLIEDNMKNKIQQNKKRNKRTNKPKPIKSKENKKRYRIKYI